MRVTTGLWVSAYVRQCGVEGLPAVVVKRGAEEAGAIFVIIDRLDGTSDLYAPAPQALADDETGDRAFQRVMERAAAEDLSVRLDREKRFDPDLWIVAAEDRGGRSFLQIAEG